MDFKPIGYIESGFKFKNGTPRQPSVCGSAQARLTINNETYSNPDHSLEGIEEFSHVWVIFVFHKNNNPYTKAKVKPPRLNGAKVGVFSTRSPYRLNPIGLTLAKIESVEGATLHLSGIDMLDGTPVLDVKPYIPLYDQPRTTAPSSDNPEIEPEVAEQPQIERESSNSSQSLGNTEVCSSQEDPFASDSKIGERTLKNKAGKCDLESDKSENVDNLQESLSSGDSVSNNTKDLKEKASTLDCQSKSLKSQNKCPDSYNESQCSETESKVHDPGLSSVQDENLGQVQNNQEQDQAEGGNKQVEYADWIKAPPFQKLTVRWTPTAEEQLQNFSKDAVDERYRLEFIKSTEEAQKAVHDILHADPRSSYRRKKCVDRLYFFMVDVLHVTCWFNDDENVAEVIRVKPNREKMLQKLAGFR